MTPELSYEPTTVDPGPLSVKQENNSQEHFTSSRFIDFHPLH